MGYMKVHFQSMIVCFRSGTRIKTRKRNIAAPRDPVAFADAVVQIYLDNAGDLELIAKSLESSELNFSRYGDTFFELSKATRELSKFAIVALVDVDSPEIQVYVKYFYITLIPSTVFFFNAHHMKMDSGLCSMEGQMDLELLSNVDGHLAEVAKDAKTTKDQ